MVHAHEIGSHGPGPGRTAGGSCQEMGPAVDFAVHASAPRHPSTGAPQSSSARNALSCPRPRNG